MNLKEMKMAQIISANSGTAKDETIRTLLMCPIKDGKYLSLQKNYYFLNNEFWAFELITQNLRLPI